MALKAKAEGPIITPKLNLRVCKVRIIGDSSLICHKWSSKAIKEMEDKQGKKAKQAKAARDPEADYQDSLYRLGDGYGFPAVAFKSAAVDACTHISGVAKTEARGSFHIPVEMVAIQGTPRMRKDMVRIAMTTDIRYRGEFPEWKAEFDVRYNANMMSPEQIVNLFNTAGFAVGIGEWRTEKNGSHGMFHAELVTDG